MKAPPPRVEMYADIDVNCMKSFSFEIKPRANILVGLDADVRE